MPVQSIKKLEKARFANVVVVKGLNSSLDLFKSTAKGL